MIPVLSESAELTVPNSEKRSFVKRMMSFIGSLAHSWNAFLAECKGEYYRRRLAFCGEDVLFYPGVSIVALEKISIGSHTHLGECSHLRGEDNW